MKNPIYYLFLIALFGMFSCEDDNENVCCDKRYEVSDSQQVWYNEVYNKGTVCFYDTLTQLEIDSLFQGVSEISYQYYSPTRRYVTVDINSKSCEETDAIFEKLEQSQKVSICNNWLLNDSGDGFGLSEIFYCKLKNDTLYEDMLELIDRTKTRMIENDFGIYYLSVDKFSNGDALEMANYFYEQDLFEFAGPQHLGIKVTLD